MIFLLDDKERKRERERKRGRVGERVGKTVGRGREREVREGERA